MGKIDTTDYIGQRYGRLVVIEQCKKEKGVAITFRCKCDCGKEHIANKYNILKGATKSCGCLEKESRYNRKKHEKNLTGQRFGHLVAIEITEKRYTNGSVGWLCRCDCGNELIVRSGNLLRGHTRSCGCNKRSQYEEFIEKYLKLKNIHFLTEYRFPNCKNHFQLPFDFYIENHNGISYCIEYQGEHHYNVIKGWGGEEKFKTVQANDKIKADFCKENNIRLICLPYTLSKNEITKTLDDILEPVTTTVA